MFTTIQERNDRVNRLLEMIEVNHAVIVHLEKAIIEDPLNEAEYWDAIEIETEEIVQYNQEIQEIHGLYF